MLNRAGLTMKQNGFVHYFIKTNGNGYKAAKLAGYNSSPEGLRVIASQNLTKLNIKRELKRRLSKVLTSNEVLERLSDVADAETKIDGNMRMKALELLGKTHKLFVDKVETSDTSLRDGAESGLLKSIERAKQRDGLTDEQAVIGLFEAFKGDSELNLSDPSAWPEKFRPVLEAHLKSQNAEQFSENPSDSVS